jgi:predicted phosphodiesterase
MKIAVFSDVHGNLIALETFVKATRNEVDSYLCLGDVVNYGPWNDECLEIIHELPGVTLLEGNHERLFQGTDDLTHELPLVQEFFHHSRQFFSREDLITGLPRSVAIGAYECVHTINERRIYPDTEIEVTGSYFVGHSHHQFRIDRSGFKIVNPGSVGQNRRWINMVDYSILDTTHGAIHFFSIPYDVDLFLSEMHFRDYPAQCIAYYRQKLRIG